MFARIWFIVGVCLAPMSGPVLGQQNAGGVAGNLSSVGERDPNQARGGADSSSSPQIRVVIEETDEAAAHVEEREKQADQHDASDLSAQWAAASAAQLAATTADRQVVPTTILAVASTIIAAIAVIVSWQSLRISDQTARTQVRAYPAFLPERVDLTTDGSPIFEDKIGVIVTGKVKNSGQTPARRVAMRFQLFQADKNNKLRPVGEIVDFESPPLVTEIGAGESQEQKIQGTLPIDLRKLIDESVVVRVKGEVLYEDVFGNPGASRFDGVLSGIGALVAHYNVTRVYDGVSPAIGWEWLKEGQAGE